MLTFIPLSVTLTLSDQFPYVGDTVTISAAAPIGTDTISLAVGTEESRSLGNEGSWLYAITETGSIEVTARAVNNAVVRSFTKTMTRRQPR